MLTLTDSAKAQIDAFFTDKPKSPIRIYLSSGGCAGPRLGLALDEKNDADEAFDVQGYSFLIEKELFDQGKPFSIDLTHMGFEVGSTLELGGGGCGCSSGGGCPSSGGCGSGSCG
ncbi:IscA/HesB family protein [Fundidesulfovibrio soli]|uniref:IscA/HesB family protein n=1 Tax=Fundidesulfovibrio soli TaxID=2922716 RepID=UPI001FAFCE1A|nr:IscA/HesB family protein [Fundidesulfovibrio soli]